MAIWEMSIELSEQNGGTQIRTTFKQNDSKYKVMTNSIPTLENQQMHFSFLQNEICAAWALEDGPRPHNLK